MFAINHAATALVFKRRFPDVSLIALLVSAQAMEFAWVMLNYLGVERNDDPSRWCAMSATSISPTCPTPTQC